MKKNVVVIGVILTCNIMEDIYETVSLSILRFKVKEG